MQTPFDFLANAYTIAIGDRLLSIIGKYRIGAVAVIVPDEEEAIKFVEQIFDAVLGQYHVEPTILRVGDPFTFMRRAAGEGLAGIESADPELFPYRFMFMVRVEEAGSMLPTVLASIVEDTWSNCLTRAGVQQLTHADVLHWQRYDILDPASKGAWVESPFREWKQGNPLYELRSETHVVVLSDVPLLGDWNSPDGSFAFFTTKEQAIEYLQNHLDNEKHRMIPIATTAPQNSHVNLAIVFPRLMRDLKKGSSAFFTPKQRAVEISQNLFDNGKHRMVPLAIVEPQDPHAIMSNIFPRRVYDLRIRLHQLTKINLNAAWCVNPMDHRENAAYGRLAPFSLRTYVVGNEKTAETLKMYTVSGTWKIKANNEFEYEEPLTGWSGYDTIAWSGGQSIQLLPLDRSFVLESGLEEFESAEDLTESEIEELVDHHIESMHLEDSKKQFIDAPFDQLNSLEQFYVVCWDTITGEGANKPWCFPSFFAAIRHLAAYEREIDQHSRIQGASSDTHIGFAGSKNSEFEDLRSKRFKLGLKRLIQRMIQRKGYRPSDAADLVSLCNGTLRTLHVDYAGYAKDLLWATQEEDRDKLLKTLRIGEHHWEAWAADAILPVDRHGERLVLERMDAKAWQHLESKSRHFLSTALHHLAEQGSAPQLDYAPISIEIVKALEVELVAILTSFRATVSQTSLQSSEKDQAEQNLAKYLAGGKPPSLGNMPYLFKKNQTPASPLHIALHQYLKTLPNYGFLTNPTFLKTDINRVTHKFRNGGAHDSPIPEGICRECVDMLIGSHNQIGLIPQVAAWKVTPTQNSEATQ